MATKGKTGFSDGWPAWAKPTFALAGTAMWIGVPMIAAWNLSARTVQAGGVVDYQPIMAVLLAMTTATITGIFVFMTFRIDRGTKRKAERAARKEARKTLPRIKDEIHTKMDEKITSKRIQEEIATRITEQTLREHIEAVLMVEANGQIVADYAKERAAGLNRESITKLIQLMEDVIRSLPQEHKDKEVGWLRRVRTWFTRRR